MDKPSLPWEKKHQAYKRWELSLEEQEERLRSEQALMHSKLHSQFMKGLWKGRKQGEDMGYNKAMEEVQWFVTAGKE